MAKHSKKKKSSPRVIVGPDKPPDTKAILPGKSSSLPWPIILQALVIAAAVLWIYWPAFHGDWLWDDDLLVTDNAVVHDPSGLWKIWFDPTNLLDYQPLKFSVSWLQWHLWGANTPGYHLTNLLLHVLGALLVWRLLSKFGLRLAWLGGLIFAIHPAQVESVAWIAELKNTLSLPPFLLAMCAYIDFDERGKRRDYFLALGLFLAAMLCKPTMVMFPVIILLYAWWKRDRVEWKDAKLAASFFGVSISLGLVTVWFLHHHAIADVPIPMGGLFSRLACAGLSISFYFSKCFLPVGLMPIYPRWVVDPPALSQFLPWPVLGGTAYWLWTKRQGWGRHALLGLGFFLINLAPFVGFNAASYMTFTWVMDHVLYLPIIGLIGLVIAALGRMENRIPASFRSYGIGLIAAVLALTAYESRGYTKLFVNSATLWTYELQNNPDAYPAHNNLGLVLFQTGRVTEAMEQYEQALQIYPNDAEAHVNLGASLSQTGRFSEAEDQFKQALRIKPDYAEAHNNLGGILFQTGRLAEAREQFDQALQIKPSDAEAHYNLGDLLTQTGQFGEAIEQYNQALQIRPDYPKAHNNLGMALLQTGQGAQAMEQFEQALRTKPDFAEARYNLANAFRRAGRLPEAIEQYQQSLQIKPDYAEAHNNLGSVLAQTGQLSEAMEQFGQAVRIKPDYAEAHNNLGQALQQTGQLSAAMEQFEQALRIKPDLALARDNLTKLQALQNAAPAKK